MSQFVIADSTNGELRLAQMKMLEILTEIDNICKKHSISYWLDAGTLLGAVRHHGFIPWDDDIDICMPRDDFDKFLAVAKPLLPKNLFLQTPKTDPLYFKRTIPCKVRLNDTKIIEGDDEKAGVSDLGFHSGLFVDIFPVDRYSRNNFIRNKIQRLFAKFYYTKTIAVYKSQKSKTLYILCKLSKFIPWKILERMKTIQCKWQNNNKSNSIMGYGIEIPNNKWFYDYDKVFPLTKVEFEGKLFPSPNDIKDYLSVKYSPNYMTLPPESQRVVHAVYINLNEKSR